MINEFFDPKSNFCNIYCFFVNSAFIFWSPWAHPVMNVRFWCVAFIRIYRNVRALGVNIKNKLIHYEIDISIRQVFGFFLNMWFLVAKDKNKAIILVICLKNTPCLSPHILPSFSIHLMHSTMKHISVCPFVDLWEMKAQ